MSSETTPRRDAAAVEALVEEFELRSRIDEPDASLARHAEYDLSWARDRIDAARRAAEADVITADEALQWLAAEVGRDLPEDEPDPDEGR